MLIELTTVDKRKSACARRKSGYFTVKEVAEICGTSNQLLWHYIHNNKVAGPRATLRGLKRKYYRLSDLQAIVAWWNGETK
jgi:predicted DNA-binding transcriptional regulator AlpA